MEAKAKEAENELQAALEEEKMLRRQLAELEAAHSDGGEDQQMACGGRRRLSTARKVLKKCKLLRLSCASPSRSCRR
jgi:DNA repair ATPase RecN